MTKGVSILCGATIGWALSMVLTFVIAGVTAAYPATEGKDPSLWPLKIGLFMLLGAAISGICALVGGAASSTHPGK